MTEVRPAALALAGLAALQGLNGPLERHDFAGQQVFAHEVFVRFAARGLIEVHHRDGDFRPAEQPAGLKPPLPGDQPAFRRDDDRVQQAHFLNALGQGAQVSEILPVAEADLDLLNVHPWAYCWLSAGFFVSWACTAPALQSTKAPCRRPWQWPCPRGQAPFLAIRFFSTLPFQFSLSVVGIRKHSTVISGRGQRCAVQRAVRKADPAVIPRARPLHQQRVHGIDGQRPDRLQDVGDGRCSRTGIAVVVHHVRKQAADAGTLLFLNEHVAVIAIAADRGEDHRNALGAEVPARRNPRRIVVHAADRDIAGKIDAARAMPPQGGTAVPGFPLRRCTPLQVLGERRAPCSCRYPLYRSAGGSDCWLRRYRRREA